MAVLVLVWGGEDKLRRKLPFPLIYDPGYDLNLGTHVFPSQKFRLIRERFGEEDVEQPEPATDEQMLLAHDPAWLAALSSFTLTPAQLAKLEIPWGPETLRAVRLATGGSILAARNALRDRIGFNLGGGFHHAFAGHGEGFCAINDIAVAIRVLQHEQRIQRAMVVDCDVHHGNGTAAIFANDPTVATLSIHQLHNYPYIKPPSTLDIDLWDGVRDEEYLEKLSHACLTLLATFQPDLLIYVAGADPYIQDQLGGLALTMQGLQQRDRFVFSTAKQRGIPVAVVLAGGYARNVDDTVAIHCNTVKEAAGALIS